MQSAGLPATKTSWLNFAPAFTLAVFLLPIAAGLVGTLLPAFGYLPAIGGDEFSFAPWHTLWEQPGIARSIARHGIVLHQSPLVFNASNVLAETL